MSSSKADKGKFINFRDKDLDEVVYGRSALGKVVLLVGIGLPVIAGILANTVIQRLSWDVFYLWVISITLIVISRQLSRALELLGKLVEK